MSRKDQGMKANWTTQIPDEEWSVYQSVIRRAKEKGLPFALGGAFAVATNTGRWRNTKDLDFYILPEDREKMIQIVTEAGLQDYYDRLPYQRHWIYRSHKGEVIVDLIWAMANDWEEVDEAWLTRGPRVEVRGEILPVIPPEELIWAKLYVLQKDRCDWSDILNIIYATGETLDWEHLLGRLIQDLPLLRGVLSVFAWLSPGRARELPGWLWERLDLLVPETLPDPEQTMRRRADRLDTRPWFIPVIPEDEQPFS
jgi:hypothetical protein